MLGKIKKALRDNYYSIIDRSRRDRYFLAGSAVRGEYVGTVVVSLLAEFDCILLCSVSI